VRQRWPNVVKIVERDSKDVFLGVTVNVDSEQHISVSNILNRANGVVCRIQQSARIVQIRACVIGAFTRASVSHTEHHGVVSRRNAFLAQSRVPKREVPQRVLMSLKDVKYWGSARKGSRLLGNAGRVEEDGMDHQIHQHAMRLQWTGSRIACFRVSSIPG